MATRVTRYVTTLNKKVISDFETRQPIIELPDIPFPPSLSLPFPKIPKIPFPPIAFFPFPAELEITTRIEP